MSDMVERVGLAVFQALAGEPNCLISRVGADKAARTAIAAMRKPTEAMAYRGDEVAESLCYAENGCEGCEPTASPGFEAAETVWSAMIDAALK